MKKTLSWLFTCLMICSISFAQNSNPLKGKKVLIFSKTGGFRHSSIPFGIKAIQEMGKLNEFQVDTTENAEKFNDANLKNYRVVIFMSTTGNILNEPQQIAFERYIQAGGAFLGVHAASDTEYDWPWYGKLVGGYFNGHPGKNVSNVQMGKFLTKDKTHISTNFMPDSFEHKDEFYSFKDFNTDVKVLLTVDENSYKEGTMGDFHPMSWYHEYDGGRSFYTNWGHPDESFSEEIVLKHLWGGLQWAASGNDLNYAKARSVLPPEENRFTQTVLTEKLDEPTELAVLDNGKVLFTERKGLMKAYNPITKKTKIVADLNVYSKFEYGLMGINIDPNYNTNHWVYLYYAPSAAIVGADTASRLARFVYDDVKDTLVMSSEKILLKVKVKRNECCHTGGSIDWDAKGNLYLSTGDDTNPFDSKGFAPIDERPGRAGWDARSTSSNTNDLRGKVLRIKPMDDGTYSIPAGNLFPVGTEKTRPEIYTMGTRNSYRISVDKHTGYLYWGDVGNDAGENSEKYGPRGHDEVNQARKAGYHGWPLFTADNRPYNQRSFAKDSTWAKFDPAHPINDSPHNTGLRELPPATKAFIYYPYVDSPEFGAVVGKGGRNAMAGPVFYSEDFDKNSNVSFPKYFDGKFFAYDWMRDWINIVSMKPNGDFIQMERFLPSTKFNHPIDLQFAKNGSLYVLEYGQNWFAQNDDARLSKIEFSAGNRKPVAVAKASKNAGAVPMKVNFSTEGTLDYDGDALKYEWTFGKTKMNVQNPSFTYTKPGVYNPSLKVTDAAGNVAETTIEIKVGNEVPKVDLQIAGNKSFFWNDQKVNYEVKVSDKEDGSMENKKISPEDVQVDIDYLEGFDKTMIAQGHQKNLSVSTGKRLIDLSDCKSCHSVDQKSIGPNYKEVAKKYKGAYQIEGKLADKIVKGGGGVWGEQAMAAHPQISKDDAKEMVKYILSLADDKKASKPVKGDYVTKDNGKGGTYIFSASYTDKGANNIAPQTDSKTFVLRSAKMKAVGYDDSKETMKYKIDGLGEVLIATTDGGFAAFNDLDLTGIGVISVMGFATDDRTAGGKIEVHLDAKTGPLVGTGEIPRGMPKPAKIAIAGQSGKHNLYFIFTNPAASGKALFALSDISFEREKPAESAGGGK